jgi:hypothetical protein
MGKISKLLTILGASAVLAGCDIFPFPNPPHPTPPPNYFCNITYEVTGTGGTNHADITFGDEKYCDPNDPNHLVWLSTTLSSAPLPQSFTEYTCKGHPVKLGVCEMQSGTAILTIKNEGNIVAQKEVDFLGSLEYNIPGP